MDLIAAVQRVLQGDVDSFAAVVHGYQVAVGNFVAMSFPRPQKIEELSQEIFIRAFRQLPAYELSLPFWPWLRGIARNVILEEMRAEQRAARERRAAAELALLQEAETLAREREVLAERDPAENFRILRDCLRQHPEEGSRLLQWFYVEGLTSDAIAARMGCGGSAVRNALMRIRRALRDCVDRKLQAQPMGAAE